MTNRWFGTASLLGLVEWGNLLDPRASMSLFTAERSNVVLAWRKHDPGVNCSSSVCQ